MSMTNTLILLVDKLLRERALEERQKDINTVYFGFNTLFERRC